MRKLKITGVLRTVLLVLTVTGILLFFLFTSMDRRKLQRTVDDTIAFARARIQRYEDFNTNDKVKSLIRLLDKSTELSRVIAAEGIPDQEKLDRYVEDQRLSGVLILDENMRVVLQNSQNGDTMPIWENQISGAYVRDILKHPEETYSTRLRNEGILYDFAAVARQDAPGLLITYIEKEEISQENGDLTMDTLFAGFHFQMDGALVVSDGTRVVATNVEKLLGKQVSECRELYREQYRPDFGNIVCLHSGSRVWYGSRQNTSEYELYVFIPSGQAFMARNVVCGGYVLLAVLLYVFFVLCKNHTERENLEREHKRLQIIDALGLAYSSISLVDLGTETVEVLKGAEQVNELIAEPYRKAYLEFTDMATVAARLDGHASLSFTAQTEKGAWLLTLIVPQKRDRQGQITAVLVAVRDVTEEQEKAREQDQALRSALAAAEHANRAKTVFLNNMSHDIRTPMNAIIGFTALAAAHINNTAQVQDYLKKISTSGKHLLSLINDVLDMSRIESGSVKIEQTEVHLPDVLHDLRSIIQGSIHAKQLELYIDIQDVIHEDIITDRLRLNQVLLNIVGNAIKFTPTGGIINIRVSEKPGLKAETATYEFFIRDNGIGMSKEFQEHIFDSFSRERTATESGIQGTGLGMAIARNIVHLLGGTITLKSAPGKGSEFTVTLECRLSGRPVRCELLPELKGARVLVVDDDTDTCMSISKMLRSIELEADWTTSGREAVLRAKEAYEQSRAFKVYIIDWLMPDMNGIETVRRIRRVIGNEAPIIILTAYDWADIETEAREAGVTAFVSKPLFLSDFRAVLAPQSRTERKPESVQRNRRFAGKRVLLVEDNELNCEIATVMLEELGLTVDSVEDGADAVMRMEQADAGRYDLIFMDIQMPRMDGYMATREIRTLADSRKANIPIIAMTANAFEEDKQKALAAGMNGHMSKPIEADKIEAMLERIFPA